MKRSLRILDSALKRIGRFIPSDSDLLYFASSWYVNRYNGDSNNDLRTNGELRFMQEVLPTCTTVFDVGANVGDWAELAIGINPHLRLHCFEPSVPTYKLLAQRGLPSSARLHNLGLGSVREDRQLYLFESHSGANSLYLRKGLEDGWNLSPQTKSELVSLDTVDGFCKSEGIEKVDFLKIDVEGHEMEVLRGALETFSAARVRFTQFEYGGSFIDAGVLLRDVFDFFEPLPYNLYKVFPRELRLVRRYDQRLENFQYQNWVAVKE